MTELNHLVTSKREYAPGWYLADNSSVLEKLKGANARLHSVQKGTGLVKVSSSGNIHSFLERDDKIVVTLVKLTAEESTIEFAVDRKSHNLYVEVFDNLQQYGDNDIYESTRAALFRDNDCEWNTLYAIFGDSWWRNRDVEVTVFGVGVYYGELSTVAILNNTVEFYFTSGASVRTLPANGMGGRFTVAVGPERSNKDFKLFLKDELREVRAILSSLR